MRQYFPSHRDALCCIDGFAYPYAITTQSTVFTEEKRYFVVAAAASFDRLTYDPVNCPDQLWRHSLNGWDRWQPPPE